MISRHPEGWRTFGITRPGLLTIPAAFAVAAFDQLTWILYFNLMPLISTTTMQDDQTWESITNLHPVLSAAWVVTDATKTRLFYSSYLLIRFGTAFRSVWKAALASSAMYGLLSIDFGLDIALAMGAVNMAYCVAFILFRRLWPLILGQLLLQAGNMLGCL